METVKSIEQIRGTVKILLSSGQEYRLKQSLFRERPLSAGDEIDCDEYEKWLLLRQYKPALARAVDLLAMKSCSTHEVRSALARSGYTTATVDMVLFKLEKEGFLDDAEFARQYIATRSDRCGTHKLRQDLLRKGVERGIVDEMLETVDPDNQFDGAVELVRKALRNNRCDEEPYKTRRKLLAMLARKGFSYETGLEAVQTVLGEYEE